MAHYIVTFPNKWYLRGTVATGDADRASRFATAGDATKALAQARHYFKASAMKGAEVVKIDTPSMEPCHD